MVTVAGNTMTSVLLCPDDLDTEYLYTAEGKSLRFSWVDPDAGFEVVMVYTRR